MKSEDYWVLFSKSGRIEDYLTFRILSDSEQESEGNETEHKGTDNKGTEYR
ncbi:MAG: hypothetical protein IJL63_00965 [Clostridia bacterium]|nr:hypothetical protein [Clostridia bacterium]